MRNHRTTIQRPCRGSNRLCIYGIIILNMLQLQAIGSLGRFRPQIRLEIEPLPLDRHGHPGLQLEGFLCLQKDVLELMERLGILVRKSCSSEIGAKLGLYHYGGHAPYPHAIARIARVLSYVLFLKVGQ